MLITRQQGLPHALDPYTLETIGLDSLNGVLKKIGTFAAHFRIDPQNGHLVTMSMRPEINR